MQQDIIPFGKYRGQPLERLSTDRQYMDWLAAQPWFRERYANLYTIIINNFSAPSDDTPEHNAMQALFLEKEFSLKFVNFCRPNWHRYEAEIKCENLLSSTENGPKNLVIYNLYMKFFEADSELDFQTYVEFENKGLDVVLSAGCRLIQDKIKNDIIVYSAEHRIEIKPSIGDDFPTVLRQVKALRANVLFLKKYVGSGISEQNFLKIFSNEGIRVVFSRDVA